MTVGIDRLVRATFDLFAIVKQIVEPRRRAAGATPRELAKSCNMGLATISSLQI